MTEAEVGITEVSRALQEPVAKSLRDRLSEENLRQHVKCAQRIYRQTARV